MPPLGSSSPIEDVVVDRVLVLVALNVLKFSLERPFQSSPPAVLCLAKLAALAR